MKWFSFILLFIPLIAKGETIFLRDPYNPLLYDLQVAQYFDKKLEARFPITYSHLLTTGYFTTPSSRMGEEGEFSFGVAKAPPYLNWNARFQAFNCLELSANYRVFEGVEDINLTKHGFGWYADRGANIKWALITPEDTLYDLPGLAIGVEDFMGTKKFLNYFAVLTKIWPSYGLETSLGYGTGRYTRGPSRGFFGAISYFPLWECDNWLIKDLGIAAEFDPIDYKNPEREPSPLGRSSNCPINLGLKYKCKDVFDFSLSIIRGKALACAGSLTYNFGQTEGFVMKVKDPPFYAGPIDYSPICDEDESSDFTSFLSLVFDQQGFRLTRSFSLENILWISLINQSYRSEACVKERIEAVLASLTPVNIDCVVVIIESYGMPCQQYIYPRELLLKYKTCQMGRAEFDILTPRLEFSSIPPDANLLYYCRLDPWRIRLSPRFESFFGNSRGKFKYDLGVKADVEGFLPYDIYYELQLSYTLLSSINDVSDFDFFSPSQLPNVLTDYVNYRKQRLFSTDKAYVQKNWNLSHGWFSKLAFGYFQVNYAGLEGEFLWYPADRNYAFGLEGALLRKRRYTGLWFQSKLRKLDGMTPTYIPYTVLSQYFFNFYLDIPEIHVASKVALGSFLANDKGIRLEVCRYFESGLRITGWMTFTNALDKIHGENYYNRGIALELPLDIFFRCSSRRVWNYGMAAWLRDAGASLPLGKPLFNTLNQERRL